MSKELALKPRMSEKSYAASLALNTYVFDVPLTANKIQIAQSIEAQFGVSVTAVRVVINKGKVARSIRIGARARANVEGRRNDIKKAYVTLKEGDTLPVFAAVDEQIKKETAAAEKAEAAKKSDEEKPKRASRLRLKKETK